MAYNERREVSIVEGHAPYGISTEERINKKILKSYTPQKPKLNPIKTALRYQDVYQSLPSPSMKKAAGILGVSRVRVYQMLNLLKLDKAIINYLLKDKTGEYYTERQLRDLLYLPIDEQFKEIEKLHNSKPIESSNFSLKQT